MRIIDADRLKDILEYGILCNVPADAVNTKEEKWNDWVQEIVDKAPTVEAIPKADYETRLKADLEAILVEIKLEIEEMSSLCTEIHGDEWNEINTVHSQDVLSLIQEKIDALRGIKNGR